MWCQVPHAVYHLHQGCENLRNINTGLHHASINQISVEFPRKQYSWISIEFQRNFQHKLNFNNISSHRWISTASHWDDEKQAWRRNGDTGMKNRLVENLLTIYKYESFRSQWRYVCEYRYGDTGMKNRLVENLLIIYKYEFFRSQWRCVCEFIFSQNITSKIYVKRKMFTRF